MREVVQNLNKAVLARATGISYSKLRKYASGSIASLTPEEKQKIQQYLLRLARQCV